MKVYRSTHGFRICPRTLCDDGRRFQSSLEEGRLDGPVFTPTFVPYPLMTATDSVARRPGSGSWMVPNHKRRCGDVKVVYECD